MVIINNNNNGQKIQISDVQREKQLIDSEFIKPSKEEEGEDDDEDHVFDDYFTGHGIRHPNKATYRKCEPKYPSNQRISETDETKIWISQFQRRNNGNF